MSTADLRDELQQLQRQRRGLLRRLAEDDELAVGTVSVVRRKCGNPRCRCAAGVGHLHTQFLFTDESGRRHCKLVRKADEQRMQKAGESYRRFRDDMKELRAIDRREKEILMALRDGRALRYD